MPTHHDLNEKTLERERIVKAQPWRRAPGIFLRITAGKNRRGKEFTSLADVILWASAAAAVIVGVVHFTR